MSQSKKDFNNSPEVAGAANSWKDRRDPQFGGPQCPEGVEVDEVHNGEDPYEGKVNLHKRGSKIIDINHAY